MNLIKIRNLIKRSSIKVILIFMVTFILLLAIMITSRVTKTYSFQIGEIAKEDIEATREVTDQISTESLKKESINSVALKYSKKTDVKIKLINEINSLLNEAIQLKDTNLDEKAKIDKLKDNINMNISDIDFKTIINSSKEELKKLQEFLDNTMNSYYDSNNVEEDNGDNSKEAKESMKKAKDYIELAFNSANGTAKFSKELKDIGIKIANLQIKPNYFYDKDTTEQLRKDAEKRVAPVVIKKDQIIVKRGEPVTFIQISILKDLGLLNNNSKFDWYIYGVLAGLVLLVLILQWYYLYKYHEEVFKDISKLALLNVLNIIALVLARTLSLISPFLIPFACVPILISLLLNHRISMTISVLNCILISAVVGFKVDITLLAIVNATFSGIIMRKMEQRNDIIYSALPFSIINVTLTFFVGFLMSNNIIDVITKSGFSLISAIISSVLAIGFLPFFESTFDIITTVKLLELTNPNHELLKRLLIEAPGTYHHSLLVANLAEVAASKVGGNTVLTRVASYYHDVGKIKRPYFFKENQLGNDNPHDKITPNMSALIITSHVKDGLEMAKEYKLPKVIQNIIEQHHGNYLVKYFYLVVKNSSDNPEEIQEMNFRYQGPIPNTKESGIIMLADAVEASVRSIANPTNGKIEEMVNNIIKERLNEGQLDHCDLTLKDIDIIRKSFLKSLSGIYHKRIEYPNDKWENKR
ncbi:MAG: HDIG domain-containing protein [Clostridiaceae bacterium]|nr:HDIG domain-containing protein [Clostridiaceae bacterium]